VTEPAATGLPRWPILLWFPGLLFLLMIIAVALGISGSSTGAFWQSFGAGTDPSLIAGTPRGVRSDEWLTFGSWLVSQASQGYPAINQVYPGGTDTTVLLDLPSWSWITLFRPNSLGFLFLGLDRGLAFRWWLSALALMSAAYWMLITLLPRRPLTSAVIAVAFFFSPLLQWWFLPSTLLPAALAMLAIATVVYSLRDDRLWVRIVWAALTAYLAVATVLTFYPPYIIPSVLVGAAISVGALLAEAGRKELGIRRALVRLVPLLIAAVAAGFVLGLFVLTHRDTFKAFTDTVYPGTRIQPTGALTFDGLVQLFGAPFGEGLINNETYSGWLGPNSSEAAAPVLLGLFLIIPLIWFVVRDWRERRQLQWMMIACIAATAVLLAWLLIPGWDFLAHLVLLDRTITNRVRIGLALLCVVAIALLVRRLDEDRTPLPWSVSWAATGAAAASIVVVWAVLAGRGDPSLTASPHHRIIAVLFVLSVLLYTRRQPLLASVAFLIISILVGAAVNPLYRGIFDLTETSMGQDVERINAERPGSWLGIGSYQLGAVLAETGVQSFNGVQPYPSYEMWSQVDPTGKYSDEWNRYSSLAWVPGPGEPVLTNPQADVTRGTFDACSTFAQEHVTYVMTEIPIEPTTCLREIDTATAGPSTYQIFEVVPAG